MSKDKANQQTVIIDGVEITPQLMEAIVNLKDDNDKQSKNQFAEHCLMLSAVDIEKYGIDRSFFSLQVGLYRILSALFPDEKGGDDA